LSGRSDRPPAHLLLGGDVIKFASHAGPARAVDAENWREINVSTDVAALGIHASIAI